MAGLLEVSWFLDWAIKWGIGQSKAVDAAVEALGKALIETRIYLLDRSDGAERDRNREKELARLWHAASQALRHVDDDTARLARMKSEYWLRPRAWENHQAGLREIELSNVIPKYRRLSREPPDWYEGMPIA
jgi:hypothetical protein